MLRLLVALIFACAAPAPAAPQDATPQPSTPPATRPATAPSAEQSEPPPEAVALLRKLDHPEYAQREQAEKDLLALAIAQPQLQEWISGLARSEPSPEVRTRLASVVAKLKEHRLLGATMVTLHVKDVHPRELINELARQAGVRFEYWPQDPWEGGGATGGKVSLDLERVAFWEAMGRVSETTGLRPMEQQPGPPGAIVLSPHAEQFGVWPTHHYGAFAVQLRRLHRDQNANVELGVGPDGKIAGNSVYSSTLALELRLLVEPKVRLTGSVAQPSLDEAIDEQGVNLIIPAEGRRFGGRTGWSNPTSGWSVQTSFPLDAKAASKSRSIARLRGRMEAEVATEIVKLEVKVSDLVDLRRLKPQEPFTLSKRYRAGPYEIELTTLRRSEDGSIHIDFTIIPQRGTPNELQEDWARMQSLGNALRLEDAAGREWASAGGGQSWDGNAAQASRSFQRSAGDNIGPPERFVWEVPAKVMMLSIPFEFTDIPLPALE